MSAVTEKRMPPGAKATQCQKCGWTYGTHAPDCVTAPGIPIEKIRTAYEPLRNARDHSCDWSATSENYEASWEGEEAGFVGSHPIGFGASEQEAIADYKAQVEDER